MASPKKRRRLPSQRELELLSCVMTERNGRDVAKLYLDHTGNKIPYSTVYTLFNRMEEEGWVRVRKETKTDRRVRWFKILGPGIKARQESLASLVGVARVCEKLGLAR